MTQAQMDIAQTFCEFKNNTLICKGDWQLAQLAAIRAALQQHPQAINKIDLDQIQKLDTAGALFLIELQAKYPHAALVNISPQHQQILNWVSKFSAIEKPLPEQQKLSAIEALGRNSYFGALESFNFICFVGELFNYFINWWKNPKQILWRVIAKTIEQTGYRALPIVGLLSFLVGIVLAYQMGVQLQNYGANIFVVNLLGIALLREFSPLMTAIIVAGRSGSAFTAAIGTMKVNQEVDALQTLGISPVERLALGQILGLICAMPLLSMWSAITGIIGGMIMSKAMLGITFPVFLQQFEQVIKIKQLWLGLIKTPVFAGVIAGIGCFQGFRVAGGADSVGQQTTRSVVQSIFLIIVVDAFFSIVLSMLNA